MIRHPTSSDSPEPCQVPRHPIPAIAGSQGPLVDSVRVSCPIPFRWTYLWPDRRGGNSVIRVGTGTLTQIEGPGEHHASLGPSHCDVFPHRYRLYHGGNAAVNTPLLRRGLTACYDRTVPLPPNGWIMFLWDQIAWLMLEIKQRLVSSITG